MIGPQQNTISDVSNPVSSFFSSMFEGLQQGARTIGSEILPNWVAGELNQQKQDLLNQDTFDPKYAQWRLDQSAVENAQTPTAPVKPVWFDGSSLLSVSGNAGNILMIGIIALGALLVFRKL